MMRTSGKTVRLFESDLLEEGSRVHPVVPVLVWTPVVAWFLWRTFALHHEAPGTVGVLVAAGLLTWSFAEYVIHRFVFHLAPRTPARRRLQFLLHGVHHDHPDDVRRVLMPPVPAAAAALILYGLFRAALGPRWVEPFFAAFLAGYLVYDYTHLYLHLGRPRTRLGRYLRRSHMRHHFATPDAHWGVTSPLWDWVFRTTGGRQVTGSQNPVTG
jgi:dihydroceramide fatty acyl 2-hydroxylase